VREPVSITLSGETPPTPVSSQPVELPQPVVTSPADSDAAAQPRRSGWWRKR